MRKQMQEQGWDKKNGLWTRRSVLAVAASLLMPRIANAAITLVNSAYTPGDTNVTMDTTGCDFLVAIASTPVPESTTSYYINLDSLGNLALWVGLPDWALSTNIRLTVWYCVPTTVGVGHHIRNAMGGNFFGTMMFAGFHGVDQTTPYLGSSQNSSGGGFNISSQATGSITPTNNNALMLSAFSLTDASVTATDSPSQTSLVSYANADGFSRALNVGYNVQGSKAAQNQTWTPSATTHGVAGIVSFNAAGGGTPAKIRHRVSGGDE